MVYVFAAAIVLLLVVLIHLIAGWIIADGLHEHALVVGPKPKDLGVRVREASSSHVILEAPGPRQDIGHPGILGLSWDGGYGQVGDVIEVSGGRVTRSFSPMTGTPPVCPGPLEACDPVELDSFAYPSDPGDVGLQFEETTYESQLGPMGAWVVPAQGSTWAVHCHGWTAERREHLRMLRVFHREAITSLVIDYRNDPGAPRDASGLYRFGLTEWRDLEAAVSMAVGNGAGEIVLSGCSTGGALIMAFLERSPLAEAVSAVVLDAPNVILVEAFRRATRDARATRLMIEFGLWITDLRWKVDWETTNFVQRAVEILRVPTLVFHGTSDQTIPISVSRQLQAAVPELVQLVETPAAGHVMSWNADPDRYERHLRGFLGRIGRMSV